MPGSSPSGFSWPGTALMVTFLVLWTLAETVQRDGERHIPMHLDSLDFAASDLAKSVLSLFIWLACRQLRGVHSLFAISIYSSETHIDIPFHELEHRTPISRSYVHWQEPYPRSVATLTLGNVRSTLSILAVGFVYALRAYADLRTRELVDPLTLYLAFPVTIFGILSIFRITSWRNVPNPFWHAALLHFAGFFIARDALAGSSFPPYNPLVAFALCDSIWISLVDMVYGLHCLSSIHLINSVMFGLSFLFHSLLFLLHPLHGTSQSYHHRFTTALQELPLIEGANSIVMLFVIQQYGAIVQGILIALASTLLITVDMWKYAETLYSGFLGCGIAIVGFSIFILCEKHSEEQHHDLSISTRRCFAAVVLSLVALGHIVIVAQNAGSNPLDLPVVSEKTSGQSGNRTNCRVPELLTPTNAQIITNYTHFSNVLLIVFFSHARYDANLDFHREVYADYFPNIVYIGPATREDKGFTHSYDVVVDSFQSEEDLSDPLFYKMAGRMAHHMLYTALREYGCYDGYLWVPFDTLLNVPRLQQFDQSLFWYHSPWGQPVPNLAFDDSESGLSLSRHAPPAMISPDPSINLTETWRGWGPDWWWGDPHVGMSVCMNAYDKVPAEMRDRLAQRNGGKTRLIGGSADTLYIPGRHRQGFMDVLALFLETNCFLEIATPTTVHLVVPLEEPIQFVDHWWIWEPPFNASFVRQKWAQGYEVDTFHTFHWGERGVDGVWRGDHRHVADVRQLLRESADRQGLGDGFPVNLGDKENTTNV